MGVITRRVIETMYVDYTNKVSRLHEYGGDHTSCGWYEIR